MQANSMESVKGTAEKPMEAYRAQIERSLAAWEQVQRRQRHEVAERYPPAHAQLGSSSLCRAGTNDVDSGSGVGTLRAAVSTLELTAHQLAEDAETRARAVEHTAVQAASLWEQRRAVVVAPRSHRMDAAMMSTVLSAMQKDKRELESRMLANQSELVAEMEALRWQLRTKQRALVETVHPSPAINAGNAAHAPNSHSHLADSAYCSESPASFRSIAGDAARQPAEQILQADTEQRVGGAWHSAQSTQANAASAIVQRAREERLRWERHEEWFRSTHREHTATAEPTVGSSVEATSLAELKTSQLRGEAAAMETMLEANSGTPLTTHTHHHYHLPYIPAVVEAAMAENLAGSLYSPTRWPSKAPASPTSPSRFIMRNRTPPSVASSASTSRSRKPPRIPSDLHLPTHTPPVKAQRELFESRPDDVSVFRARLSGMEADLMESIEQSTRQLHRLNQRWPVMEHVATEHASAAASAEAAAERERERTNVFSTTLEATLDALMARMDDAARVDAATQVPRRRTIRRGGDKCGGSARSQVTAHTRSSLAKHVLSPHWIPI